MYEGVNPTAGDDYMFIDDLEIGKRAEKLVAAALAARGHDIQDVSDDSTYQRIDVDLLLNKDGKQATLEIKNDLRSEQTGNVFIEIYNRNNERRNGNGWYCYCEADYIAFVQENRKLAHIVSFRELVNMINECKPHICRSAFSAGYVIAITELQHFNSYFCLEI